MESLLTKEVIETLHREKDKLNRLIDKENSIVNQLLLVFQLLELDVPSGLSKARNVAETICVQLMMNELPGSNDKSGFERTISELTKHNIIPDSVSTNFHTLRILGNYGAHPKDFSDFKASHILDVVNSIVTICEWYMSYKSSDSLGCPALSLPKAIKVDFESIHMSLQEEIRKRVRSDSLIRCQLSYDEIRHIVLRSQPVEKISSPDLLIRKIMDALKQEMLLDYQVYTKFGKTYFDVHILKTSFDAIWDQWAEVYADVMLTIWIPGVKNPLYDLLGKIPTEQIQRCIDFGCGHGHLVERISAIYPHARVEGIDYSKEMLRVAKAKHPQLSFICADIRNLRRWKGKLDLALSTNSLLPPTPEEAYRMFAEVMSTVRIDGYIAGVLPSGDTIEHLIDLRMEQEVQKGTMLEDAKRLAAEYYYKQHKFDPIAGLYADDPQGQHLQKMYWPDEITELLSNGGFSDIKLEKVYYPWTACRAFGWGYFPAAEQVWDWTFIARKVAASF